MRVDTLVLIAGQDCFDHKGQKPIKICSSKRGYVKDAGVPKDPSK